MTYANEDQRYDVELNAAVIAKLVKHREDLVRATALMRQAHDILANTDDLHHGWGNERRHHKASRNLANDIDRMQWFIDHILNNIASEYSAYAGNIAAFLDPAKAKALKEEYRRGKI